MVTILTYQQAYKREGAGMKIEIEINENDILEEAKKIVAEKVAKGILENYTSSGYCYRHAIKDVVREVIKSDIDNLSDRAVKAASTSITNKAFKKIGTEELLARLSGTDGD